MNLRLSCIHDCKDAVFSVSMIFLFLFPSFCCDGMIYFQNLTIFKGKNFYCEFAIAFSTKVMQLRLYERGFS
jgi:hypothetical protein